MRRLLVLGLVTAALAGCANVDSQDLRTSGMIAHLTVVASRGHTVVDVHLGAGGLTDVVLADGESLRATARGQSVVLHHVDALGDDFYTGALDLGRPGTKVTVALLRTGDDADAPVSTVELPAAPVVRTPRPHARISRSHDLEVRVAAGSGILGVSWTGGCLVDGTYAGEDGATSLVIPAGTLRASGGKRRSCLATMTVSRSIDGSLDPAYRSGSITAIRRSQVVVRSVP